jgi:hypothetical protein
MKKLNFLGLAVGVFLVIVFVSSAKPPETQEQREARFGKEHEERKVANLTLAARKVQRNPASFAVEDAYIGKDGAACIVYRSQNGFGGMNRGYVVQVGDASETAVMDHERGFTKAWNKVCLMGARDLTRYAQYQIGQPRDR